jgi:hypothetical protein
VVPPRPWPDQSLSQVEFGALIVGVLALLLMVGHIVPGGSW